MFNCTNYKILTTTITVVITKQNISFTKYKIESSVINNSAVVYCVFYYFNGLKMTNGGRSMLPSDIRFSGMLRTVDW